MATCILDMHLLARFKLFFIFLIQKKKKNTLTGIWYCHEMNIWYYATNAARFAIFVFPRRAVTLSLIYKGKLLKNNSQTCSFSH